MKRKPVISSDIKSVSYDEYALIMEVEFHKGGIYRYSRVPLTEYKKFMSSESKGKYFVSEIKNNHRYGCQKVYPERKLLRI